MSPLWMVLALGTALAQDDPCADVEVPDDYDEQVQTDFLLNYFALTTTFSPIHAPVPHEPGHGSIGLGLAVIPPLACERRLALNAIKTEETNKSPVLPRPQVSFAMEAPGGLVPFAAFGWVPPLQVLGQRTTITSGELGVGRVFGESVQLAIRAHATSMKTVAELVGPIGTSGPEAIDVYYANTIGIDGMGGVDLGVVTPYLAAGFVDASTFLWIGDDGVVSNNRHPYAGLALSAGVDALIGERLRAGGELYVAPGGTSRPDPDFPDLKPRSRYGNLATARVKVGVEL